MNTHSKLEVWQHVEKRVQQRVKNRKLRHARFWKLEGAEAKKAVIQGTVARLMAPDAVFPYALRKRLAPRQLVSNLSWRPIDPTLWKAWLTVHEQYIEHGEFWFEKNDATDKLVDSTIDAERKHYCEATADSGGPNDGKLDPELSELVSRFSHAGQVYRYEPTREIEQQAHFCKETAALDARERLDAEENTRLRQAINAAPWARKLPIQQRRALNLICFEPTLKGSAIAVKCRVSESTVSKIKANVEDLADSILTILPEEDANLATTDASINHDETLTQISDAGEIEGSEIDSTADLSKSTLHSDTLDLITKFQAPDVDADVSESTLQNYAKQNGSNGFGSQWGKGRRSYGDVELVTGSRYGGRWADPAKIALCDERKKHVNKFSDAEMRDLQQKAAATDIALNSLLRTIDSFIAKRAAVSADDMLGLTLDGGPKPTDGVTS